MGRRKGVPNKPKDEPAAPGKDEPAKSAESAKPAETSPPTPDPPAGKKENPKLGKKREQIAKGWDITHSKAMAKKMPSTALVNSWVPIAEMFVTMTDVGLMLVFGPAEVLKAEGALSERNVMVKAWASRMAVEPPENIKQILSVNLVAVYLFVLMPRIQRAWLKPLDENDEKCVVTSIKGWKAKRDGKQEKEKDPGHPRSDKAGDKPGIGQGSGTGEGKSGSGAGPGSAN